MEYLPVKAVTRQEAMGEPPTPHLHELKVSSGHQAVLKWGLSTTSAGSHSTNSPQLWSKPPEMPRPELTPGPQPGEALFWALAKPCLLVAPTMMDVLLKPCTLMVICYKATENEMRALLAKPCA